MPPYEKNEGIHQACDRINRAFQDYGLNHDVVRVGLNAGGYDYLAVLDSTDADAMALLADTIEQYASASDQLRLF